MIISDNQIQIIFENSSRTLSFKNLSKFVLKGRMLKVYYIRRTHIIVYLFPLASDEEMALCLRDKHIDIISSKHFSDFEG